MLRFIKCCVSSTRDYKSLREEDIVQNNQLAFDLAEREFGISPTMTGKEMSELESPDKLTMVAYISRFYDLFKDELPPPLKGNKMSGRGWLE